MGKVLRVDMEIIRKGVYEDVKLLKYFYEMATNAKWDKFFF